MGAPSLLHCHCCRQGYVSWIYAGDERQPSVKRCMRLCVCVCVCLGGETVRTCRSSRLIQMLGNSSCSVLSRTIGGKTVRNALDRLRSAGHMVMWSVCVCVWREFRVWSTGGFVRWLLSCSTLEVAVYRQKNESAFIYTWFYRFFFSSLLVLDGKDGTMQIDAGFHVRSIARCETFKAERRR